MVVCFIILRNSCSLTGISGEGLTLAILIFVEFVDHGLELFVGEVLAELAGDATEVLEADAAGAIFIEESEGFEDFFGGVAVVDLDGHDVEEVGELDLAGAVAVVVTHEVEHLLLADVEAQRPHGDLELVVVNGAGLVGIEQVERLLDLLALLLAQLLALRTPRLELVYFPQHFKF